MTVVLALLLASQPAGAPSAAAQRIEKARALAHELEYQAAAEELSIVLADPALTDDERFEANLLAGVANRVMGRDVEARLNFLYVLRARPDAQLPPDTPPKIVSFFELVRQEVAGAPQPAAPTPTAPATTTAPAQAPAPEPPAAQTPEPEPPGVSLWLLGGGAIALAGASVVVGTGAAMLYFDQTLGDPAAARSAKEDAYALALPLAAGMAAGSVLVVAGACVAAVGFVE